MATLNGRSRQYSVPTCVFAELFNFAGGYFERGKQTGWRQFYSQLQGPRIVTRSNRVNKKSLNITGKHRKVPSREWCRASFNFTAKLPINSKASDVVFDLLTLNSDLCDCGMFAFCYITKCFHVVSLDAVAGGEDAEALPDAESNGLNITEDSNDSGVGSVASTSSLSVASRRNSFVVIDSNRPLLPVLLLEDDGTCKEPCECKISDDAPCGRFSDCVHVHCEEECDPSTCPAGVVCRNQMLSRKDFPSLFIDAEYYGNLSRYINHSCGPNTLSERIKVGGNMRIAIVSKQIIKAVSLVAYSFLVNDYLNLLL